MLLGVSDVAFATFSGTTNGNVAFVAICNSSIGQAIYSVNPNGSPPPTYTCPGGTSPNYSQTTAGATDSMPYFSASGSTLYFSSNRGSNSDFAIYEVPYPSTITGSPGSQSDGATQLTFPSDEDDYAPTVSADGTKLAFIRCGAGGDTCSLYVQSPIVGGTPTLLATDVAPAAPDSTIGAGDRPEFDPANSSEIIYVATGGHIHLVSLTGSFAERDLSAESGLPGADSDEYPDWSPTGNSIIFDSDQIPPGNTNTGDHFVWTINPTVTPATRAALWGTHDPGNEIEPIYAPEINEYAWTLLGSGSNIQLDMGTTVSSPTVLLTDNKTDNSQSAWQPVTNPSTGTPEAPSVLLLPAAGLFMGGAGWIVALRRRRRSERA
jgi:Tol biopolymer transport system component